MRPSQRRVTRQSLLLQVASRCVWIEQELVTMTGVQPNEDALGTEGTLAWVIDGATSLSSQRCTSHESDGLWLVEVITEAFREEGHAASTPRDVIRLAIEHVTSRSHTDWAIEPEVPPSAAVGLVRVIEDTLHYAILADVSLIHDSGQGPVEVTDDRPDELNVEARTHLEECLSAGLEFPEAIGSTRPLLIEHRRTRMNVPGGYWVLALNPEAADQAITGVAPTSRPILLASDGFTRGRHLLGLWTDWQMALSETTSLQGMADEVRAAELDDSAGTRFPRWSLHDDIVAGRLLWSVA